MYNLDCAFHRPRCRCCRVAIPSSITIAVAPTIAIVAVAVAVAPSIAITVDAVALPSCRSSPSLSFQPSLMLPAILPSRLQLPSLFIPVAGALLLCLPLSLPLRRPSLPLPSMLPLRHPLPLPSSPLRCRCAFHCHRHCCHCIAAMPSIAVAVAPTIAAVAVGISAGPSIAVIIIAGTLLCQIWDTCVVSRDLFSGGRQPCRIMLTLVQNQQPHPFFGNWYNFYVFVFSCM